MEDFYLQEQTDHMHTKNPTEIVIQLTALISLMNIRTWMCLWQCLFLIILITSHMCPPSPLSPLLSKAINQTVTPDLCGISMGGKMNISSCVAQVHVGSVSTASLPGVTCLSSNYPYLQPLLQRIMEKGQFISFINPLNRIGCFIENRDEGEFSHWV